MRAAFASAELKHPPIPVTREMPGIPQEVRQPFPEVNLNKSRQLASGLNTSLENLSAQNSTVDLEPEKKLMADLTHKLDELTATIRNQLNAVPEDKKSENANSNARSIESQIRVGTVKVVKSNSDAEHKAKPIKAKSLLDARNFLNRMRDVDYDHMPKSLKGKVTQLLSNWTGAEIKSFESLTRDNYRQLYDQATRIIHQASIKDSNASMGLAEEDNDLLQKRLLVRKNPPPDIPLEAEYAQSELQQAFPKGIEIQQALEIPDLKMKIHIHMTGEFYVLERLDGSRQTLRFVHSERPISDIQRDLARSPSILPAMQGVKMNDGSVGLMQEWVNGHYPRTPEEKLLCGNEADSLGTIPWEQIEPNTPFDLNTTNFLVSDNPPGKVHYVDADLPEIIVKYGLSDNPPPERISALNEGKKKIV